MGQQQMSEPLWMQGDDLAWGRDTDEVDMFDGADAAFDAMGEE
jgi:hypothetical protein